MKTISCALLLLLWSASGKAQSFDLTLMNDVSSKMKSGEPFVAKDEASGKIGAGKARLVAAGAAGVALLFMKGGNVTLKAGYHLKVEPDR